MPEQGISQEFSWNNPALGTLRACDVAEVRQLLAAGASDAEVATTLWSRAGQFRRIRRSATDEGNTYDFSFVDGPAGGQSGQGAPAAPVPPEIVDDIQWLHAGGIRRDRLGMLFGLSQESLAEILPGNIQSKGGQCETTGTGTGCPPDPDADRDDIPGVIEMTPGIRRRVQAIRDWEPPEGVRQDVLVEANARPTYLKVSIRCDYHEEIIDVSKHAPIAKIIESLNAVAAVVKARAYPPQKRAGTSKTTNKASK